jgi:biopolymer transport protein ExbD
MRAFLVVVFVFGSANADARPITERPVEVPIVAGTGYDALDVNRLSLIATPRSLVVDGTPIQFEHTPDLVIPQVKQVLQQRLAGRARPELTMFLDRTTPYRSLIEIAVSAREAGVEELYFATQTSTGAVAAPLALPTAQELEASKVPGVMVSVLEREILIWSRSGLEGTLAKPKRSISIDHPHALRELTATLDDIVQRWWLPRDLRTVSLQADADVPVQTIAHVIGALRQTADGRVLFSSVALAG